MITSKQFLRYFFYVGFLLLVGGALGWQVRMPYDHRHECFVVYTAFYTGCLSVNTRLGTPMMGLDECSRLGQTYVNEVTSGCTDRFFR